MIHIDVDDIGQALPREVPDVLANHCSCQDLAGSAVAAVEANPYAASDGVLARLELKVGDRQRTMVFDVRQNTKLWRGNSMVLLAGARIDNFFQQRSGA